MYKTPKLFLPDAFAGGGQKRNLGTQSGETPDLARAGL